MERKEDSRRRTRQGTSRGRVPESGYHGPRSSEDRTRGTGGRNPQRQQRPQAGQSHKRRSTAYNRRRKKRIWRRVVLTFFAVILVCIIGLGAYGMKLFSTMGRVEGLDLKQLENPNLSVDTVKNMKKYWTIAAFGVDAREGESLNKGVRSDVIMICSIEQKTGNIKLVSVYRDTYAKLSSKKYGKINEAYAQGGPEQAIQALNENFDLQIDDYITVNWKAVIDAINILDGIDVEITDNEFKYMNSFITNTVEETGVGSHHLEAPGMQHLDGVQAVAYSRLRLMDTDFQRTERQRKVIQLCMDKAKKADFSVLNNVLVTVLGQVTSSFEINDLARAAQNILNYNIVETTGFPFELKDQYIGKQDCVIPTTLSSNVSQLHQVLFGIENYTPSSTVETISANIEGKAGSGGGSKVNTSNEGKSSTKTATKATEAPKTTEAPREEETEETLEETEVETLEEETAEESLSEETESTENEEGTEESNTLNEESEGELETKENTKPTKESTEATKNETESSSKENSSKEEISPETSKGSLEETEKPKDSGTNIFTEKPTDVEEQRPEGPGKIEGNAGVSAPGETLPQ